MDDTLKLIAISYTKDDYGVQRATEIAREILCRKNSVTKSEFFACKQVGLSPEFVFDVAAIEYEGETEIEYRGKRYAIYRTYRQKDDDYIELYAEQKRGVRKDET